MIFYNETHPGISLPTANTGMPALDRLRGYFPKEDIAALLEPSNCVGIRIYNILTQNGKARLMLVGVKENGLELINLYMLSHDADSPDHKMPIEKIANQPRSVAFALANGASGTQSRFASFFSKTMLNPLLAANNGFTGIAFYTLDLENIHNADLPGFMQNIKLNKNTHIGVASNIDQIEGTILLNPNPEESNIVCDIPCPGNCFKKATGANPEITELATEPHSRSGAIEDHDPYLIEW